MKILSIFLILFALTSCSEEPLTLEKYANGLIKFAKKKISPPKCDFSLMIPENWEWTPVNYIDQKILFGIEVGSETNKDGYYDALTIFKTKSFNDVKDLKSEFNLLLKGLKKEGNAETIVESGKTDLFKQNGYFVHFKSDAESPKGEYEMISFILESETVGVYYYIDAIISRTENIQKNMTLLIQCLKTFETKV